MWIGELAKALGVSTCSLRYEEQGLLPAERLAETSSLSQPGRGGRHAGLAAPRTRPPSAGTGHRQRLERRPAELADRPWRCRRLEANPDRACKARRALAEAGATIDVQIGDSTEGWAPAALYDPVIATYAVGRIPWAWVEQTKPGGRILTPWGRLGRVTLTVADDARSATGWVQGLAQFMPDRRPPHPGPRVRLLQPVPG